jgi:hypothetical protein
LLASLLSGVAAAYELSGVTWEWQDHPFEDPIVVDVDTWPAAYSDAEVADAIEAALDTWTGVGLDLALPFGGTASGLDVVGEGNWSVVYDSVSGSGWGGTLAYASTWAWKDGIGIDCDVTFLSDNDYGRIRWSTDPGGPSGGEIDLEAVALHEQGHCLGLDHSGTDEAVMYYAYQGLREPQDDDVDGVSALFGATPCVDDDGDGFTDCDADCDDADASVHPGAPEVCDGVDQGCDGVVDSDAARTVAWGPSSSLDTTDYVGIGNAFVAEADTLLLRARQRFLVDAGTRLVWSLRRLDAGEWTLVRSERSVATGTGDEASPDFFLPLAGGETYVLTLGAYRTGMRYAWDAGASTAAQGPVRPLGLVYGRAQGDDLSEPDDGYLIDQELDLVDLADTDGDGTTALCGDPCPLDPADGCDDTGPSDGKGSDDGGGDEGTPDDSQAPDDSAGADDSAVATDDTGVGAGDDGPGGGSSVVDESAGGCACGSRRSPPGLALGALALALARRRQSQVGRTVSST